ncbi:MAG: prepilin peptidase [candidate division WOR-3 bacterium]|nr:prepilin peptidase [candidate division WOR-3 bacterium]MCR4424330.1 prepilin peptidase [candidate division WOR-3 bacterium]MDH7518148.1 prepilin peptidase [bacterium]
MIYLLTLILGLVFGSFFNVCIWRIPRGESINYPPSRCPRCGKRIRFYDNIPVVSFLILRGRCRDCGKPIAIRYPLVELLSGLLFLLTYIRFGLNPAILRPLTFIGFLVILAGIDIDHKILPFRLSLSGLILGIIFSFIPLFQFNIEKAFWGGVIGAVFVLFAWALWRFVLAKPFRRLGVKRAEGMGWGDLPFAAMIGVYVGPKGMVVALAVAVVSGVIAGVLGRIWGKTKAGTEVPFGPFLALGGLVGLYWGEMLFDLYLRAIGLA